MNAQLLHSALAEQSIPMQGLQPIAFKDRLRQPRFWVVQGLVFLAAAIHLIADATDWGERPDLEFLLAALTYILFALPVVYAGLYFGQRGAIPTAIWAGVLTVPVMIVRHSGSERGAEVAQHLLVMIISVIIANRVDREVAARREAETAASAQRRSEARLRALFEAAGEPILVFDQNGRIHEANKSAIALFGESMEGLRGHLLTEILGEETANALSAIAAEPDGISSEFRYLKHGSRELWLEPVCSRVLAHGNQPLVQAIFHDITEQRQRRKGLEAFARQIVAAQEDERRRIARDLHDGPLQGLVLLCRRLDEFASRGNDGEGAEATTLQQVRHDAESIAGELRMFSRGLRPSILDDLGLEPAVRWLVKDLEQRTGTHGQFTAVNEVHRIAPEIELGLFRVTQEALRNVERHAGASEVTVTLIVDADEVRLIIADNGRGVDGLTAGPGRALSGKLGLLGMQERVRLMGGRINIHGQKGSGTRVEVTVPPTWNGDVAAISPHHHIAVPATSRSAGPS